MNKLNKKESSEFNRLVDISSIEDLNEFCDENMAIYLFEDEEFCFSFEQIEEMDRSSAQIANNAIINMMSK